ncbi:MAG: MFS transporter [Candidatus Bathyarchaeia archaeon]
MNSSSLKPRKSGNSKLYPLYFLGFLGMTGIGLISPTIALYALKLGANELEIGLIYGIFSATVVFTMLPFGYLSDLYGKERFLSLSFVIALISFISYAFVRDVPKLILVRGFHGLFISSFYPSAYAMAIALSSSENRGTILGLLSLSTSLGFASGNFLSGILVESFSFETAFYFCGSLALIGLLIIFTKLKSHSQPSKTQRSIEIKSKLKLLKSKKLIFILFNPLIAFYSYGVVYAFFPVYGENLGLTKTVIGFYLAGYSIANYLMSALSGKIIDRLGSIFGIASGLVIGATAYFLLFFSKESSLVLMALLIAGISNSLTYLSSQTFLADEVSMSVMGSAIGIFSLFLHIGMAGGPIVTGIIVSSLGIPFGFLLCSFLMLGTLFGIRVLKS